MDTVPMPDMLPVRKMGNSWEVELPHKDTGFQFDSELDAKIFASAEKLQYKALHGGFGSEALAGECERLSKLMEDRGLARNIFYREEAISMRKRLARKANNNR